MKGICLSRVLRSALLICCLAHRNYFSFFDLAVADLQARFVLDDSRRQFCSDQLAARRRSPRAFASLGMGRLRQALSGGRRVLARATSPASFIAVAGPARHSPVDRPAQLPIWKLLPDASFIPHFARIVPVVPGLTLGPARGAFGAPQVPHRSGARHRSSADRWCGRPKWRRPPRPAKAR